MFALQDVLAAIFFMILGMFLSVALRPRIASRPAPVSDVDSADTCAMTRRLERACMAETQAKSLFENLLANAHDGLIMVDGQGLVVRFNPEAQRIFGRSLQDVTGKPVTDMFSESSAAKFAQYFDMASRRDAGNSIVAVRHAQGCNAEGRQIDLDLTLSFVLLADAGMAFLISLRPAQSAVDTQLADGVVRELKKSRDDLKATRHRLNVAKLQLAQMTHAVSHDLRSPIVNMMGFAEHLDHLARKLTSDPVLAASGETVALVEQQIPKTLDFMNRSGRRLCDRVEAFHELSRLGQLALEPASHTVRSLLATPLAVTFGERAHEVACLDIADDLLIEADRPALEYVLTQLLQNVLDHRHPERPIALSVAATESVEGIEIALTDNGRGIPQACTDQIFELFKVGWNADKSRSGRGLAFCARLADRLGAKLTCRSEENVGSTFRLTVPRRPAPRAAAA